MAVNISEMFYFASLTSVSTVLGTDAMWKSLQKSHDDNWSLGGKIILTFAGFLL